MLFCFREEISMRRNNNKIFLVVLIIAIISVIVGIVMLFNHDSDIVKVYKYQNEFRKITKEFNEEDDKESKKKKEKSKSENIKKLKKENSDTIAYLHIPGTKVSYPVMQTVNNKNYYLNHSFSKENSFMGVPYLDERCSIDSSTNLFIYGHNITGKRMFGELINYTSESYYEKHKKMILTTETEEKEYKIFCVMRVAGDSEFYSFTDAENEEEYKSIINQLVSKSIYDCSANINGVTMKNQLMTLSTCADASGKSRLLVIGVD